MPTPLSQVERGVGREGAGKQSGVNTHAHSGGRQACKRTLAVLSIKRTLLTATTQNTHSHNEQIQTAITTVGGVRGGGGGGGGGIRSFRRLCGIPCHSFSHHPCTSRFQCLGPWFDLLDFRPGLRRPSQVCPLQADHLHVCDAAGSDALYLSMRWSAPPPSGRTQDRDC